MKYYINIAKHEFTGKEIGELLLASVRQIKAGECTERQIPPKNKTTAQRKER